MKTRRMTKGSLISGVFLAAVLGGWRSEAATNEMPGSLPAASAAAASNGTNGLCLNFRNAPLKLILEYFSEAAGFIINPEAELRGNVDVWSKEPVSREEAVVLLNSVLRKNGYALVRRGRVLTICSLQNAPTMDLEVVAGSDPAKVEKSEEVVTQIIPVRFISASQLVNNLRVLLPASVSLSANESANALVLVAAKADVHRALEIICALDSSKAVLSTITVFQLHHADAKQLAASVQQIFSAQTTAQSGGNNAGPGGFFPGGGFGPPGFRQGPDQFGNPGNSGSSSGGNTSPALGKVTAVADEPSNSMIVCAPPSTLSTISNLVRQIDQPVAEITELRVFTLTNAVAAELADQLMQLFPDTTSSADQNQLGFRFGPPGMGPGGFGGPGGMGGGPSDTDDQPKKKGRVQAVADARTSSLLVSAPVSLMPKIEQIVWHLDANAARKEKVNVYELANVNPTQLDQILQDLFNRNGTMRSSSSRSPSSQNDALLKRQTQQQQNTSSSSGFNLGGSGRSSGTGGSGGQ